ncbi:MAG: hypothetical protein IJQ85_05485 [Selenomonadaceae bacterium]|nr:hypothetical protein [Selenomonadaceae bacterium]
MTIKELQERLKFNAWLNDGEYNVENKFTWKSSDVKFVDTQEEFDAIVEKCIKEGLWGLTPEGIKKFLSAPIVYSGFNETDKTPEEIISELARNEKHKIADS